MSCDFFPQCVNANTQSYVRFVCNGTQRLPLFENRAARRRFVRLRYRVFEVYDNDVGSGANGFLKALRTVARDEQEADCIGPDCLDTVLGTQAACLNIRA